MSWRIIESSAECKDMCCLTRRCSITKKPCTENSCPRRVRVKMNNDIIQLEAQLDTLQQEIDKHNTNKEKIRGIRKILRWRLMEDD